MKKIYLAGGCFWGLQKFLSLIQGVTKTTCGYVNGEIQNPTYEQVCSGTTNFKEAVEVYYQDISLETILFAFFRVINPTVRNRQGNDIGTQYQTGIYYSDPLDQPIISKVIEIESQRHDKIVVEVEALKNFYPAEEYHQDYLNKNPNGYCHINLDMFEYAKSIKVDAKYQKPSDQEIKESLSDLQYQVTQKAATEAPFNNEFYNFNQKGIYVDIVTKEPLFTSKDKFHSSCGWPAFSRPIDQSVVIQRDDYSHGRFRQEVLSRSGNSHLGHVFEGDPESENGIRYCINSASLKFIPYDEMDEEYSEYKKLLED